MSSLQDDGNTAPPLDDGIAPPPSGDDFDGDSPSAAVETNREACTLAMACHLLSLCLFTGIPFGNIIAPLILWLIKKDEHSFVDEQGKEVINFQITMTILGVICFLLTFVLIGFLLAPILLLVNLIWMIMAAVATNRGEHYRYPFSIRFL